jgi:hypothetical protein
MAEQPQSERDLCLSIPGMYRVLDLISERGTSGLGKKIYDFFSSAQLSSVRLTLLKLTRSSSLRIPSRLS